MKTINKDIYVNYTDLLRLALVWISLGFFMLFALPVQAQVGGIIAKQTAKQGVKQVLIEAAQQSVKRQVIKNGVRQVSREALQEMCEAGAKKATQKTLARTAAISSKEMMESQLKKNATKQVGKKYAAKAVHSYTDEVVEAGVKKNVRLESRKMAIAGNRKVAMHAPRVPARLAQQDITSEILEKTLNKRAAEQWTKIAGNNVAKNRLLYDDIAKNPRLGKVLAENPSLLQPYHNMMQSSCRQDITMLRYLGNNADKARLNMYPVRQRTKAEWVSGNDLLYKDINGKTQIINQKTGRILGYQSGNARDGYVVELVQRNNPLADVYPMPNTTYIERNVITYTDRYGRIIRKRIRIDQSVKKSSRNGDHIAKIRDYKSNIDTEGYQKPRTGTYDDIAGHIMPDSWGGDSNFLNIIPQNKKMNASGLWKSSETKGLNAAKKGSVIERDIIFTYANKTDQRPNRFILTQTKDGIFHQVNGTTLNQVVFDNKLVRK